MWTGPEKGSCRGTPWSICVAAHGLLIVLPRGRVGTCTQDCRYCSRISCTLTIQGQPWHSIDCFFLSVEDAAEMGVNVPEQIYSDRWRIDLTNICRDIMDLSFFHSCRSNWQLGIGKSLKFSDFTLVLIFNAQGKLLYVIFDLVWLQEKQSSLCIELVVPGHLEWKVVPHALSVLFSCFLLSGRISHFGTVASHSKHYVSKQQVDI